MRPVAEVRASGLGPHPDPESSIALVARLQSGDADAQERLFARYLKPLTRWAHGRLPPYARSMADTHDVVQDGILRVLKNVATFRPEGPGKFHAYLRQAVMSHIIDEIRRAVRRPLVELDGDLSSGLPSPYELAVSQEDREMYESCLQELSEDDRELVIGRLEWGLSYGELAAEVDRPTPDAARVAVRRAIVKLAEAMQRKRTLPRH